MDKVLVIQLSRMGDLVQTLPLLQLLKRDGSDREITLVCLKEFQTILDHQPWPDRLMALDLSDFRKLGHAANADALQEWAPWNDIPEFTETYDRIINLTHDESSAVLCQRISSRQKSGRIHTLPNEIRLLGDWAKYFFAAVNYRRQNLFNLVDVYLGIGGVAHQAASSGLKIHPPAEKEAHGLLRHHGYANRGKLVGLQLGASDLRRAWPVERFAALGKDLCRDPEIEIVLFGSEKETALASEFSKLAGFPVIDLVGRTEIRHLPALLRSCDLLVSNDTGTVHIAAAVGTRVVGLYFSTAYYAETAPYGEGHIVLQVEDEMLANEPAKISSHLRPAERLTLEPVLSAARKVLGCAETLRIDCQEVAAYESRFLSNGTLAYVPVANSPVHSACGFGFVSRCLWEEAFGLARDATFADELLSRPNARARVEEVRKECEGTLLHVRPKLCEGLALARELLAESSSPIQSNQGRNALNDQIAGTVQEISALGKGFGLFTDFIHYEIMDMDFLPRRELALELERKFQKLEKLSNQFLARLLHVL